MKPDSAERVWSGARPTNAPGFDMKPDSAEHVWSGARPICNASGFGMKPSLVERVSFGARPTSVTRFAMKPDLESAFGLVPDPLTLPVLA